MSLLAVISKSERLHRYLTDFAHIDIFWYIRSPVDTASTDLPQVGEPFHGKSVVPWRYHFNTGKSPVFFFELSEEIFVKSKVIVSGAPCDILKLLVLSYPLNI